MKFQKLLRKSVTYLLHMKLLKDTPCLLKTVTEFIEREQLNRWAYIDDVMFQEIPQPKQRQCDVINKHSG